MHLNIQSFTKMHLKRKKATSQIKRLKAVYKLVQAMEKKMDEAGGEKAAQSGHQQECILSGGVYLRHRLEKRASKKNMPALLFPMRILYLTNCQCAICGVLACRRARNCPSFLPIKNTSS